MDCKYCGQEILDNENYCKNCGARVEKDTFVGEEKVEVVEKQPLKCWSVFANTSKILGIITLCIFWIPIFGLFGTLTGIPGIVFGVLGKKANTEEAINNAKKGFITSLIGTILSVVLFISIYIAIIVIAIAASTY
jgi:hypothetical protein